jgi:hypothetical protein
MKKVQILVFLIIFAALITTGTVLALFLLDKYQDQTGLDLVANNTALSYPTSYTLPKHFVNSEIYDATLPTSTREESFVTVETPDDQWPVGISYVFESSNKRKENKLLFVDSVYQLVGASQDGIYVYYWHSSRPTADTLSVKLKIYNTKTNVFITTPYEYMGEQTASVNKNKVVIVNLKDDKQRITVIELIGNTYRQLADISTSSNLLAHLHKSGLSDNGWLFYIEKSPADSIGEQYFVNYKVPALKYPVSKVTNNNSRFTLGSFTGWTKDIAFFVDISGLGMIDAANSFKITNRDLVYPEIMETTGLFTKQYSFEHTEISPLKDSIFISLTEIDLPKRNYILKINLKGRELSKVDLIYRNEELQREQDKSRQGLKPSPYGNYILFTEIDKFNNFADQVYFTGKKIKNPLTADNTYGTTWWKY